MNALLSVFPHDGYALTRCIGVPVCGLLFFYEPHRQFDTRGGISSLGEHDAMLKMKKLHIAELQRAYDGQPSTRKANSVPA